MNFFRGRHAAPPYPVSSARHAAGREPAVDYSVRAMADRIGTAGFVLAWSHATSGVPALDLQNPSPHDLYVLRRWQLANDVLSMIPDQTDDRAGMQALPRYPADVRRGLLPVLDALGPVNCLQYEFHYPTLELSKMYWDAFPRGRLLNAERILFPWPSDKSFKGSYRDRLISTYDFWRDNHPVPVPSPAEPSDAVAPEPNAGSSDLLAGARYLYARSTRGFAGTVEVAETRWDLRQLRSVADDLVDRVEKTVPTWRAPDGLRADLAGAGRTDDVLQALQPLFRPSGASLPGWYDGLRLTLPEKREPAVPQAVALERARAAVRQQLGRRQGAGSSR